jgi:hypothetical protein
MQTRNQRLETELEHVLWVAWTREQRIGLKDGKTTTSDQFLLICPRLPSASPVAVARTRLAVARKRVWPPPAAPSARRGASCAAPPCVALRAPSSPLPAAAALPPLAREPETAVAPLPRAFAEAPRGELP